MIVQKAKSMKREKTVFNMKEEAKKKIKNFTIEVLDFLLGVPEAYFSAFERRSLQSLLNDFPVERELSCANISKLFSNLKNRGYIEVEKTNGQESFRFTNKAKLAIVDKIAERCVSESKHYFISFDIPEDSRIGRDQFRRVLKRLGFRQVQKSLWVANKNFGNLIELAAKEYGVEEYVVYLVSENTNIENFISDALEKKTQPTTIKHK